LQSLGIETMKVAGYGVKGRNPARLESFIVTEDLGDTVTLEDLCHDWKACPPDFKFKRELILRVAEIARRLHENGVNHRDFYLCHFRLGAGRLYLIDLHRAQLRASTPRRWVLKDLAGLYFSSMDIGLSRRDLYRFMRAYRKKPLRQILEAETSFWEDVRQWAQRLYRSRPE
ncbi:MAG: lipopolysaccharide core heptose(I) kinase RfaP, partial [Burkholderiales bacterium]